MGSIRSAGLLRLGGAMSMGIGGAESNVAIGLARLGHTVSWASRLGNDEIGQLVLRTLRAEGVDTRSVAFDGARPTGMMFIERRIAGISRVAYYRSGSAASALEPHDLAGVLRDGIRMLHVTGITPALSASAAATTEWAVDRAKELGATVSFDVNFRAALWGRAAAAEVLGRLARKATVVFASDDELALVADGETERDAAQSLLEAGVAEVVVKRGGDGAIAWAGTDGIAVPARAVTVVDTIGAGDAFTAGYLSARLDGDDIAARLDRGAILGAFAVSAAGDWEALPRRDELGLLGYGHGATIR